MSDWATIESRIADVLAGLSVGQEALLAAVKARTAGDRKTLVEAIRRERMPAAYLMLTGRDSEKALRGRVQLSVLLATQSLRDEREARVDGQGVIGMWSVAQAVIGSLHRRGVASWGLLLIDERPAGGGEGAIVWEQRYELARLSEIGTPTFGIEALVGASSTFDVEVGALSRAGEPFAFPGIDGVFERFQGVRERPIFWRGRLRAASDHELNVIEARIENEIRTGRIAPLMDPWGRTFESCVVKALRRKGPRVRDELSGEAVQEFEIEFVQLGT